MLSGSRITKRLKVTFICGLVSPLLRTNGNFFSYQTPHTPNLPCVSVPSSCLSLSRNDKFLPSHFVLAHFKQITVESSR